MKEPRAALRQIVRDGREIRQQLWVDPETHETEWREIGDPPPKGDK